MRVVVPTEGGYPITDATGYGTQIILTASGFEPQTLAAPLGKTITWTNLTDQVQRISFEYSSVHSGPIPPGGTFHWKSDSLISIRYTSAAGASGNVQVGVFGN
jgi:hypothetical protein